MGLRERVAALLLLVTSVAAAPGVPGSAGAAASPPAESGPASASTAASGAGEGNGTVGGASSELPPELAESPVRVTLVTGDRVTLMRVGGELAARVEPGPGRDRVRFSTERTGDHLYVVPSDATALLGAGRLDRRLFDVAGLAAAGYDDAQRTDVPLIVQPESARDRGAPGEPATPVPADAVAAAGAEVNVLPAVEATAVRQPKDRATELWDQLVTSAGEATDPTDRTLAAGIGTIWLDGVRHAVLDQSVPQVGAPQAWDAGYTGAGVRVAVLDSGIDVTHPDLAGRVTQAQNFTIEPDTDDQYGHGTHVASIVGGTGAASGGSHRGVAPDAELLNGKVCDEWGDCYESEILAGMQWAAEAGAQVVNLSLGGPDAPYVDPLEAAVNTLSATHGALFVVAAGNDGPDAETVASPASADAALAVGAVDDDDQPAETSSRGPRTGDGALKPEITGPGVGIVAARAGNGTIGDPVGDAYVSLDGTSMAAPHVAGAAALVAQQHPDWTGAQIRALLIGSANRLDGIEATTQGAGRLDVARAVGQDITAEPAAVSAGQTEWPHDDDEPVTRTITYRNPAPDPVTFSLDIDAIGPDDDAPEGMFALSAGTVTVPAAGEASVELTVDTSVPGPDGRYSAWVSATAGADGATVVTTPVVIDRETESYDLTVELLDRDGAPAIESGVIVAGLDTPAFEWVFNAPDGTATFRLPRGRYVLGGDVSGDGSFAIMAAPGVELHRDRTVQMDARETAPVEVTLQREDAVYGVAEVVYYMAHRLSPLGNGLGQEYILGGSLDGVTTGNIGPAVPDDAFTSSVQGWWAVPDEDGGFERSSRVYELAWFEHGRMLTGLTEHVRDDELAQVDTTYRATGADRSGYSFAIAQPPGGESLIPGTFVPGMPLPHRRTVLYSTEGVEWAGMLQVVVDPQGAGITESFHDVPPRRLRPGTTVTETWNQAVHGPLVSAIGPHCDPFREPSRRTGDVISVAIAMFADGAGRPGCTESESSARTTLLRNGEVVGDSPRPGYGEFTVPPGLADYRLEVDVTRLPEAHLSTRTTAAWSFRSAHVAGGEARPLPLMAVRWAPPLDDHNRTPIGSRLQVPVTVDRLGNVGHLRTPTIEASFDDGATWTAVPVRRARHGRFVATIQHPDGAGYVSLRARATDDRGNAVEQTTIRAYELAHEQ